MILGSLVLTALFAAGAVEKFAPGSVTVGGEIGRRMTVTAEKILHHTDIDNIFVKPFREHDAGTFGGFVGYGMLLDAVVQASAHGVGGEEMRTFKTRRLKEIADTMTSDGRISMYADKPGFWDNHEQAYFIQAFCRDHRVYGSGESLAAAERLAESLMRMKRPMTLGTESAFVSLWRETGKPCYRQYLEATCRIRGDIADYERHLKVNGVAHVYTWLARALGQIEYGKSFGCADDVWGAADEAMRRMFSPMLSVSGTCTGSGGAATWGETWGDSQTGLGQWGETCASAYQMRLAGEMMTLKADSRYGDLIERTLYNGFFAAQSPDGLNYRYWSPFNEKAEWYPRDTYCCPNNYKRMVFEIPDLVYYRTEDGLAVNLYTPSELSAEGVKVVQRTSYPEDGHVAFDFDFARPCCVRFRVPRWTGSAEGWRTVSFPAGRSHYELDFAMKPRLVRGLYAQHGRAALMIGPVVYGLPTASKGRRWNLEFLSEAARFVSPQDFTRTGGVVKVMLEQSYVPGTVRSRSKVEFVRFSDPNRVRTYFAVAPDCVTVDDELYAQVPPLAEDKLPLYRVTANGAEVPVQTARVSAMPVNIRWPGHQREQDQTEISGFIRLDLVGESKFTVERRRPFREVKVRPLAKGVKVQVEGDKVHFALNKPGDYSLEFDGQHENLHIFAETPTNYAITAGMPNVRYFGPGEHDVGLITMHSGETLYLDKDAVVYGRVQADDADDIAILGRGILDMSRIHEVQVPIDPKLEAEQRRQGFAITNAKRWDEIRLNFCDRVTIDGPILRDSLLYHLRPIGCRDLTIRNVKIIGSWRYNADGIDMHNCERVRISDCFLRTFDDAICIKGFDYEMDESEMLHDGYLHDVFKDVVIERCTVWNDWGHALEIGAETRARQITDITWRDCDVIRARATACDIKNCDYAEIFNVRYDDIRLEFDSFRPRNVNSASAKDYHAVDGGLPIALAATIQVIPEYSKNDKRRGKIHDITYRNIRVTAPKQPDIIFFGYDDEHRVTDMRIEGFYLNGEDITSKLQVKLPRFAAPPMRCRP